MARRARILYWQNRCMNELVPDHQIAGDWIRREFTWPDLTAPYNPLQRALDRAGEVDSRRSQSLRANHVLDS